jgi:hypothetical protein
MATFNKFQQFIEDAAHGVHDLESDQLVVALMAAAPDAAADAVLADITEISYTNLSSRNITTSASTQTTGTYKLTLTDLVLTASGAVATAIWWGAVMKSKVHQPPALQEAVRPQPAPTWSQIWRKARGRAAKHERI